MSAAELWTIPLRKITNQPHEIVVLMTSNFSESGKMTLDGELDAYDELIRAETGTALVLKPHPRDSQQKIQQLRKRLSGRFRELVVLDNPHSFYLPFESVFDRFLWNKTPSAPRVICTSSACLSFEALYGIHCRLGFGEQAVRKYFRPEWVSHRLVHERDLLAVVHDIRNSHSRRAA